MQGNIIGEGGILAPTLQIGGNLDRVLAGLAVTRNNLADVEVCTESDRAVSRPP